MRSPKKPDSVFYKIGVSKKVLEAQKELNTWRSMRIDSKLGPTPRQMTLSRLLGKPPENFIP